MFDESGYRRRMPEIGDGGLSEDPDEVTSVRRWLPREELVVRLRHAQADTGLRQDLAALAGDSDT